MVGRIALIVLTWLVALMPALASGYAGQPSRSSLGAAASGANSDITSLSGLSTPLSVGQGGTAATTAAGARTSLSAAGSGANSDITSLTGLTTPLSTAQGGTGGATGVAARASLLTTPRRVFSTFIDSTTARGYPTAATLNTPGAAASAIIDATGAYAAVTTSASADSAAGYTSGYGGSQRRAWKPVLHTTFKTGAAGDITACRIRAGYSATVASMWTADAPNTLAYAEVSYCPGTDGTAFFRVRVSDAVDGPTATTTTVAVAADTRYEWIIDCSDSTKIDFYCGVNNATPTLAASVNTDLPPTTTNMQAYMGIATTAAASKVVRVALIDTRFD